MVRSTNACATKDDSSVVSPCGAIPSGKPIKEVHTPMLLVGVGVNIVVKVVGRRRSDVSFVRACMLPVGPTMFCEDAACKNFVGACLIAGPVVSPLCCVLAGRSGKCGVKPWRPHV